MKRLPVVDDPEAGFTLTEVLAALLILAVAITGILAAMGSSIIASDMHRKLVDEDALLRSYSEALLNPAHWKPTGHECPSIDDLSPDNVGVQLGNWPGYSASVESIEFWEPQGDPPAASPLVFSPASPGDPCNQGTASGARANHDRSARHHLEPHRHAPNDDPGETAVSAVHVHATAARFRGEAGVSLIELLIAMSLTAVILVPISAAIFFGVRTTGTTETRVTLSDSMNVLSAYFVPDVQQATSALTNVSDSGACGAGGSTVELVLRTTAPVGEETSISYVRGAGANANVLYRRLCAGGAVTSFARISKSLSGSLDFHPDVPGDAFTTVTATLTQDSPTGGNLYTSRVEATRRGTPT